jgi:hypothetical protein
MTCKKHIDFVVALLLAALALTLFSCSEKSRAAVKVLNDRAEDQLVAAAGEGEVALQLMKRKYAAQKERLIRIKTLQRSMERRASESEAVATRLEAEGKEDLAGRQRTIAGKYRSNLEALAANEIEGEEALKSFAADYETFKMEISLLNEEIEAARAMGGLSDDLGTANPLADRMEAVNDLKETLQTKLDRANALLEVDAFEAGL